MNSEQLTLMLKLTAPAYLGILAAGASMPAAVQLTTHLKALPPFHRRLVWVYFIFLSITIASMGISTFVFADRMAMGDPLGRCLALFCLVFWLGRTVVAAAVFDLKPYLTSTWKKVGYQATNVAFTLMIIVYGLTAWMGGKP